MTSQDFYEQAMIAAMQALIQARATLLEDDDTSFINATVSGVSSTIGLLKDDLKQRYTWCELLAEEAAEIADAMLEQRNKAF